MKPKATTELSGGILEPRWDDGELALYRGRRHGKRDAWKPLETPVLPVRRGRSLGAPLGRSTGAATGVLHDCPVYGGQGGEVEASEASWGRSIPE